MSVDPALARARVVIAGVGGIGCPAAWALAEAGVGHLVLVDPDLVALHNLPRQVLFGAQDVGRRKAEVAAERLRARHRALSVQAVRAPLDGRNADDVLHGASVLVDATDGAGAKDGLNALAVERGVPLVHAAGVRSEARLLDVPAGGRPCLACLFGRLGAEAGGGCAMLGVWNGTVGIVGMLAALAVLRRLREPRAPGRGYDVLDLAQRRWTRLQADRREGCEVCGERAQPQGKAYVHAGTEGPPLDAQRAPPGVLDLTHERCPMNLLRARQRLEQAANGEVVEIWLGLEGAATVPDGVRALGHAVLVEEAHGLGLRLRVKRAWRPDPDSPEPMGRELLERFARQVVMPDLGEQGQRRLASARVVLRGTAPGVDAARTYLEAAGVGSVDLRPGRTLAASLPGVGLAWVARRSARGLPEVCRAPWIEPPGTPLPAYGPAEGMLLGALLADTVQRALVAGQPPADLVAPGPV
ncbi:MAG: ThiF family adenylyltransferase [Planctomycetia bacterium]